MIISNFLQIYNLIFYVINIKDNDNDYSKYAPYISYFKLI